MSAHGRREFFGQLVRDLSERVFSGASKKSSTDARSTRPAWISVGTLARFQPGRTVSWNAPDGQDAVIFFAGSEGLMALPRSEWSRGEVSYVLPLRINLAGEVEVHVDGRWPMGSALSWMTGERIEVESPSEGFSKKPDENHL